MSQKIRDHELLLQLYRRAAEYADLLYAAGNIEKAKQVQEECQAVAREHVLDRVLGRA